MRRLLLTLSSFALIAFAGPAAALVTAPSKDTPQAETPQVEKNDRAGAGSDRDGGRDRVPRDGSGKRDGKTDTDGKEAADNKSSDRDNRQGERNLGNRSDRERAGNDDSGKDVTGSTNEGRREGRNRGDKDREGRNRDDKDRDWRGGRRADRDDGRRNGHWDRHRGGHGWDRWRHRDQTGSIGREPRDTTYVALQPNASEIAMLEEFIAQSRAEIARAYQQYNLTSDKRMRNYLRQLIAGRQAQIAKLQARIASLS